MNNDKLIILITFLLIVGYFLFFYSESNLFFFYSKINYTVSEIEDNFSNSEYLHWGHMPLKYKFVDLGGCNQFQLANVYKGFEIIKNNTSGYVSFIEDEKNADFELVCANKQSLIETNLICEKFSFDYYKTHLKYYGEDALDEDTQLYVSSKTLSINENETIYEICYINYGDLGLNTKYNILGEGGPLEKEQNIITKGIMIIYQEDNSTTKRTLPIVEIHETFHLLGFGHSYEPEFDQYGYVDWNYAKDIMFPVNYPTLQTSIQEKYFSCLNYIYSNGSEQGSCSGVNFLDFNDISESCSDGWYKVHGTEYCCPEEGMVIDEYGYCNYS